MYAYAYRWVVNGWCAQQVRVLPQACVLEKACVLPQNYINTYQHHIPSHPAVRVPHHPHQPSMLHTAAAMLQGYLPCHAGAGCQASGVHLQYGAALQALCAWHPVLLCLLAHAVPCSAVHALHLLVTMVSVDLSHALCINTSDYTHLVPPCPWLPFGHDDGHARLCWHDAQPCAPVTTTDGDERLPPWTAMPHTTHHTPPQRVYIVPCCAAHVLMAHPCAVYNHSRRQANTTMC